MKKVLIGLLVIVLCFLGFAATRPNTFHIQRSMTIAAPSDVVFAKINDFHQWADWSPWEKLDPQMKRTLAGPESGTGASYHWVGNDKVGEGRMTITDSVPTDKVVIKLEFLKPWEATSTATFTLAPEATSTQVTWTMDGTNNFMAKVMTVFMNMDKMIGADFEKGLGQLKTLAETAAQKPADAATTPPPAGTMTTP